MKLDHIGHNLTGLPTNCKRDFTFDDLTHHIHAMHTILCPDQPLHAIVRVSLSRPLLNTS
jgi:hypothetical protein